MHTFYCQMCKDNATEYICSIVPFTVYSNNWIQTIFIHIISYCWRLNHSIGMELKKVFRVKHFMIINYQIVLKTFSIFTYILVFYSKKYKPKIPIVSVHLLKNRHGDQLLIFKQIIWISVKNVVMNYLFTKNYN